MKTTKTLSDRTREWVVSDGRSLREISRQAGLSVNIVSRFVRGERDMTATSLGRLLDAIGVKVSPPSTHR